jgi:5-formyltetrahydrofolate cyclo-ligase
MPTLNQNVSTILQQQQAARDAAAQRQQQLQALQAAQAQAAAQQVAAGQANRAQVEAAQQASYQASVTAAAQQDAARLAAQQAAQAAAAPRAMPQPVFTLPTPVPTAPAPQTSMQAVTNPAAMQQPIQQTPTQQPNQIIAPGVGFTLGIQGPGGSGIYDSRTGYTPGTGLEPAPMYAPDGSLIGYSMPAQAQGNQPTPQPNTGIMALAPQMNSMQPPTVTGMSKGI